MTTRYYITLPDPSKARGGEFGFTAHGAQGFADELQASLRGSGVYRSWLAKQDDPDDIDPRLAATDESATVTGAQHDLHVDLVVDTNINGDALKHRMRLLAGHAWQLRDVTSA